MTKLAVVTGGSRGIGAAVADSLEAAGYRVERLSSRDLDVTDEAAVKAYFDGIGPVEVLVNNAGISTSNPIKRTTLAEWERNHSVNATGPFLCTRAVIGPMIERGSGVIVTVASVASLHGGPYISAYVASKHAAIGLMRTAAIEVGDSGVKVATVCPTYVRTDMTTQTIANMADKLGKTVSEAEAILAETTPYGRIIEVSEVADAVMEFITSGTSGAEIVLDGAPSTGGVTA